jgi:hypothetical protein
MKDEADGRLRYAQTLWEAHVRRPVPAEAGDESAHGHDLVALDADTAGYISTALGSRGANEHIWRPGLRQCIKELRSAASSTAGDVHDYYTALLEVAEAVVSVPTGAS